MLKDYNVAYFTGNSSVNGRMNGGNFKSIVKRVKGISGGSEMLKSKPMKIIVYDGIGGWAEAENGKITSASDLKYFY